MTLVSHAWRDAFYSEPELWSYFYVTRYIAMPLMLPHMAPPPWLASKVALLRRVAPLVTALAIEPVDSLEQEAGYSSSPCSASDLFDQVIPNTLQHLHLSDWSAMPPGLLARFPNLRILSLTRCTCDQHGTWTPAVLPALLSLQLTDLSLDVPSHPPELLADLARSLPQLRYLSVCSGQPLQHAGRLTSLTALQHLILNEVTMEGACLQPPLLAQLPSLEQYVLAPGRHRGADRAFQVSAPSSLQAGDDRS